MKYLLFSGEKYYPGGGASDFVGVFTTLEEAKEHANGIEYDWQDILELDGVTCRYWRRHSDTYDTVQIGLTPINDEWTNGVWS